MKNTLFLLYFFGIFSYGQIGINTSTPQATLHVDGSLQVTGELKLGGDGATLGDSGQEGSALISNGVGKAPYWSDYKVAEVSFDTNGTLIAVDGNYVIAQEISVQLAEDFNYTAVNVPLAIPNFTSILIDNENTYTSDSTGNSFSVKEEGVYGIIMNFMLENAQQNNAPVIGIWDNTFDNGNGTLGKWVARINDTFNVDSSSTGIRNQTYTLFSSVTLNPSSTYSFRVASTASFTLKSTSSGNYGKGKVSMVIVRRLK